MKLLSFVFVFICFSMVSRAEGVGSSAGGAGCDIDKNSIVKHQGKFYAVGRCQNGECVSVSLGNIGTQTQVEIDFIVNQACSL